MMKKLKICISKTLQFSSASIKYLDPFNFKINMCHNFPFGQLFVVKNISEQNCIQIKTIIVFLHKIP